MLNKKSLLAIMLLVSSVCTYGVNKETKYILKFAKEETSVTRQGLELSSVFNDIVEEYGDDEKYFNEKENIFTIDVDSFLVYIPWKKDITAMDIKTFVAFSDGTLDLKNVVRPRLISLILLTDFFGATKNKKASFSPKRDLLNELLSFLVSQITEKDYLDYSNEKKFLWAISNRLNKNLLESIYELMAEKETKKKNKKIKNNKNVSALLLLRNGKFLLGNNYGELIIYDATGKIFKKLVSHEASITDLLLLSDGRFVSSDHKGNSIVWDVAGKIFKKLEGHKSYIKNSLLLPDGKFVSSGGKELIIYDATGKIFKKLVGHKYYITDLLLLSDGKFVSSDYEGNSIVWDVAGKIFKKLEGHESYINNSLLLPDGKFVSGGNYGKLIIWNAKTGKIFKKLVGHESSITDLLLLSDGRFVSNDYEGNSIVWDVAGKIFKKLEGHKAYIKNSLLLPDGKFVSYGGKELIIYDATGKIFKKLVGHKYYIKNSLLLSDGKFVSSDYKGNLIVWDVLDFYSNLSFEQFIFLKMVRLYSRNPQELAKIETLLVKNKKMRSIYISLPSRIKKIIKNLKWLPSFEKNQSGLEKKEEEKIKKLKREEVDAEEEGEEG